MSAIARAARNWWPVPAMLAPIVAVQMIWLDRYNATGHAAGHLASATMIFGVVFLLAVIVWASPPPIRRRPVLWILAAGVAASSLIPTIGNLRVVDAIGGDNWTDSQASASGPLRPGFVSGHALAERGVWFVIGSAVALAGWLWFIHAVRKGIGVSAIILSLIFPPWIFPGAGIIVLSVATVMTRARRLTTQEAIIHARPRIRQHPLHRR
jgi:hypothetical protein